MKKRWLFLLLGGLLCASLVTTVLFRQREPEYKGKKLSEWAEIYESSFQPDGPGDLSARHEAVEAVGHMRDQVLPLALNLISHEKPKWKYNVMRIMESPMNVRLWCPNWAWVPFYRNPEDDGSIYFDMLGPDAGPAVPQLVQIINESKSFNISQRAMDALSSTGTVGFPSLAQIIADPASPYRRYAVWAVGAMTDKHPDTAKSTIPLLVKCLNDGDLEVRDAATNVLAEIAPVALSSARTVPAPISP